jgi:small subunit ribosomal protein S17
MANERRRLVGRVVSDKMDKTVTVAIERRKSHPIYKKVVITTKKVLAHDESNEIKVGALVRLVESKPLSKNKRWVVEEVLAEKAQEVIGELADEAILHPETTEAEASDTGAETSGVSSADDGGEEAQS